MERGVHSICKLRFNVPNQVPVVFYNRSNYDYHLIIKELANKFAGQFEYLGKNTEKYETSSVPIEEKIRKIDKDGNEDIIITSYKLKFINSAIFMTKTLSFFFFFFFDSLEEIHEIKCKDYDCFLQYEKII